MKCLQIHNDYIIPGGETISTKLIAEMLEENNIQVIRYYKDNKNINTKSKISKLISGIQSIYNPNTIKDINKIIQENDIDFALIHNVSPIISNSIYSTLNKNKIPIIKYIQNYNLICLNGAIDNVENICSRCLKKENIIGVKNKCYKDSLIYTFIKYINKKLFDKFYEKTISRYIAISRFIKNEHCKYGVNKEKIEVIHHFVDKIEPNFKRYEDYYLYYGRLSEEKGIKTLINLFVNNPELKLYIMGQGQLEDEIRKTIKDYKLTNIKFLGYQTGKMKEEYIKNAYCTIVPSEWNEPFGRVVIESYSFGTPVIGSDKGGIHELIIDDETGFVFKSKNEHSLYEKINLLNNKSKEEYEKIRENCAQICKQNFSKESYFEKFKDIIYDL